MSTAVAVTDGDFELEIEKHEGLAVVDFWATWCGPCRIVEPTLDQLALEFEGKAKVMKMDVDTNIKTPARFSVRSIPAILFFKDGVLIDQVIGAASKAHLEQKFKQHAAAGGQRQAGGHGLRVRKRGEGSPLHSEHSHRQHGRHV